MRARPLDGQAFAALMAPLGPFEPAPLLAVAVSGGADSLALALLADEWARARGGLAVALTVDHRLRPESEAEATQVAAWMAARGIAHHVLTRAGPPPAGDVQAQARAARLSLLAGWCAGAGCLHLLLAHHREDQAETLLLRLARGSGVHGLAAMAAVSHLATCRVLRPLLPVPAAALRATLTARGQPWIEDPSNQNPAFARVRMRALAPVLAAEGADAGRLAATARRMGRARQALEAATDALLAAAVIVHPQGFARLDPGPLHAAPEEVALRALAAMLATVGGSEYPPRGARLERLLAGLTAERAATLGGCRLDPAPEGTLWVTREARALPVARLTPGDLKPGDLKPGESSMWDGRFRVTLPASWPEAPGVRLGPLGNAGWRAVQAAAGSLPALPLPARGVLPALWPDGGAAPGNDAALPLAAPSLGWARPGWAGAEAVFFPRRPLTAPRFRLAPSPGCIM